MARAAGALAVQCANVLDRVYGARSCCSSEPATTAVTRCSRVPPWPDEAPGSTPSSSRSSRTRRRWRPCAGRRAYLLHARHRGPRTSGPRRRRHPRHRRPRRAPPGGRGRRRRASRGRAVIAVDVPSGVDASTGAVTGPAVHADSRSRSAPSSPVCLSRRVPIMPVLSRSSTSAWRTCGAPALEALQAADVAERWPWPATRRRQVRPRGARRARRVGRVSRGGVLCVAGALGAGCGYVRSAARPGWRRGADGDPEGVVTEVAADAPADGRRSRAGLGGGPGHGHRRRRAPGSGPAGHRVPWCSMPTR